MASYSTRVKQDVVRWIELGYIDAPTGEKIARDVAAHERRSLSFGNILAIMAALLLAAAVLVVVAANWEAIPRLVRVSVLFLLILGGYVGGAVLKNAGQSGIGEGLWIIAAAAFGGSIALIGQMYHLSGDESGVFLTWGIATGIAAAALRSNALTIAAVVLLAGWMTWVGFEIWGDAEVPYTYPLLAAALWAVSLWTGSRAARDLILLSLVLYAFLMVISAGDYDAVIAVVLAAVSALVFVAAVLAPGPVESVADMDGRLPVHGLIGFLAGMFILHPWIIAGGGLFVLCVLVTLAGIVGALMLAGRESRGLRWIAYIGFTLELLTVYIVLAGSMLGTAGLFLSAGLALGAVAFLIIRIEKRMNAPLAEGAAA